MSSNVQNICLSIYLSFQIIIITIIFFFLSMVLYSLKCHIQACELN